jgi:hypothetical protein
MPNRLRRRSRQFMADALMSLGQAFRTEAARQERERVIECARTIALLDREITLHASPFSWPATMMQEMQVHHGELHEGDQR